VSEVRGFALVLAGGEGRRLWPLTADRAKPAVPFGGNYRLIDFALSNLVNAQFRRIAVLTQYKSHSLDRHLTTTWNLSPLLGNYVAAVPAQQRRGPRWYAGSADAIYQSLNLIYDERPDYIVVFGADHIYRTDPRQMIAQHLEAGAGLTVAAIRIPAAQADQFGVIEPAADGRTIQAFHEKELVRAQGIHDRPDTVLASMGNYVFDAKVLIDIVTADSQDENSSHDIGRDIIPRLVAEGVAQLWDFAESRVPGVTAREHGYWRDIGTLDAYHAAHMDLISVEPTFNLYNEHWPILKLHEPLPAAKFVHQEPGRTGMALDSMVCAGVVVSGGVVRSSVLSPGVRVHSRASVEGSVLLHGVDVGRDAIVRNAIVDKNVQIAPGARVGVDPDADRERFHISADGIVVIAKGATVDA
jgi:glucose-1-phosphate adenylyltransferase